MAALLRDDALLSVVFGDSFGQSNDSWLLGMVAVVETIVQMKGQFHVVLHSIFLRHDWCKTVRIQSTGKDFGRFPLNVSSISLLECFPSNLHISSCVLLHLERSYLNGSNGSV